MTFAVAALYRFAPFDEPAALRAPLLAVCNENAVKGTLLLAREGINGTIAGTHDAVSVVIAHIRELPGCADLDVKWSTASEAPFQRMKVRLKKEIVTLGEPGVDPASNAGRYVAPADWNALIADPDTILIDTRNDYEVAIGSFERALNPKTKSFGEFPAWFRANRDRFGPNPKIAMFCTGGIRCEKSTAFLKSEGLEQVYHLKGGILAYLEHVAASESRWQGECFVFDERVSIGHGLTEGQHRRCKPCGWPVKPGATQCGNCGATV